MLIKDALIVDDDPQMLIAMSEAVKRNDFSVATAGNGIQALEILKETQFRIVITDLRMPGITGLDVLREVKAASPRSQVILVTAHGSVNNAVEAMKMGAFDYLLKPFALDDLHNVVQRAIRKNESFLGHGKSQSQCPVITQNPDMLATIDLAEQAAKGRATMLIQAESGTGKELLARWIHESSPRSGGPYIAVNCAALPENLLEAELFGYEKGAFTGANAQKPGKFEMAHGGTILLDEIGEMVPMLQAKLLRVLQEQEIDRLGGRKPIPVDIRVIATTNKSLKSLVREGTFREDLYYRLNVIPLTIPPLRNRREDIPLLARHFCEKHSNRDTGKKMELAPETVDLLVRRDWTGNIRELENVIHRGVALATGSIIYPKDLFLERETLESDPVETLVRHDNTPAQQQVPERLDLRPGLSVSEMEKKLIHITLEQTSGNRTRAADLLGISLRTLRNKLREYRQEHAAVADRPAEFARQPLPAGKEDVHEQSIF
jgi:DNA-binding NtrC family response regulator